jgi:hypothetical protein
VATTWSERWEQGAGFGAPRFANDAMRRTRAPDEFGPPPEPYSVGIPTAPLPRLGGLGSVTRDALTIDTVTFGRNLMKQIDEAAHKAFAQMAHAFVNDTLTLKQLQTYEAILIKLGAGAGVIQNTFQASDLLHGQGPVDPEIAATLKDIQNYVVENVVLMNQLVLPVLELDAIENATQQLTALMDEQNASMARTNQSKDQFEKSALLVLDLYEQLKHESVIAAGKDLLTAGAVAAAMFANANAAVSHSDSDFEKFAGEGTDVRARVNSLRSFETLKSAPPYVAAQITKALAEFDEADKKFLDRKDNLRRTKERLKGVIEETKMFIA